MAPKTGESGSYGKRLDKARYAIISILVFSLIVFVAIAAVAVYNEGAGKFLQTLESLNPFYYSLALLSVLASDMIGFPKWDMFVRKLGVKISRRKNFEIYMSMFSMDITPGRWGRAIVSYTLNKITGVRFARTFPAVVADIFTDFLGFIGITLIASVLVKRYAIISVVISALLLVPFIFIYERRPFDYLRRKLGKNKRLQGFFEVADTYFESHKLLDRGSYAYALIFTIPAVALNGLALYFVMLSFGVNIGIYALPTVLFIYTSALLIGMVSGIPGTLGITDAAMLGYLIAFFGESVNFGLASVITIFFRVASLWFVEGVSFLFLLHTMKHWGKATKRPR